MLIRNLKKRGNLLKCSENLLINLISNFKNFILNDSSFLEKFNLKFKKSKKIILKYYNNNPIFLPGDYNHCYFNSNNELIIEYKEAWVNLYALGNDLFENLKQK